jgi:hypothetical protein
MWRCRCDCQVTHDISRDARLSKYLGIQQQAQGLVPATPEHRSAAASLRSTLAHPECWELDVNDAVSATNSPFGLRFTYATPVLITGY